MGLSTQQWRALFFAWLPAAIGVLVICVESTDYLSAANTRTILEHFWAWLGFAAHPDFASDNHLLRKTGHFTGYGTLSLLFYRGWRCSSEILSTYRHRLVDVIFSFACTFVVASADEYHQSFLPSRTGQPQDVLLDITGAAVFLVFFQLGLVVFRWRHKSASAA